MPHIETSRYGESRLRMLRVLRHGDRDDPRDVTVGLRFDGRADAVVPGEAVKNLVHRVARGQDHPAVEDLALAICARVLADYPSITSVRADLSEQAWVRIDAGGKPHGRAFVPSGADLRTARVTRDRETVTVTSGIDQLMLLRTDGFAPPAAHRGGAADGLQRLLIATLSGVWTFASDDVPYALCRAGITHAIVETFAWHASRSAHEALRAIADVALATCPDIETIDLSLNERPYRPADLLELALEGDSLFLARDEPVGTVELRVTREPGTR
jgi:urate oxidase